MRQPKKKLPPPKNKSQKQTIPQKKNQTINIPST